MGKKEQNKKVIKKQNISNDNEVTKLIKMVVIVTVLFLAFYLITVLVTNKDKTKKEEKPVEIQYDTVLIGNILQQPNDVYYVLVEDMDDDSLGIYEAYLEVYSKVDKASRVYFSILNHPLNISFKDSTSKTDITDISQLKLKGTTLLKIEKGKITKAYEDKEEMKKFLYVLAEIKEEKKEEK
ncbi:MAG: hypothetical protein RSB71_03455 [Bacilli bacterium]